MDGVRDVVVPVWGVYASQAKLGRKASDTEVMRGQGLAGLVRAF